MADIPRLNGVIRALESGKPAFTTFCQADPETAIALSTTKYDGVVYEMEHNPWDIRALRDSIFFTQGPASPAARWPPTQVIDAERAKLKVLNGTAPAGLAARTTDYLTGQGFSIVETGNADQVYGSTTLYDYTGKPYTLKYLAEAMAVDPSRIYSRYDPTSPVDVVVVLGNDWAASNSIP